MYMLIGNKVLKKDEFWFIGAIEIIGFDESLVLLENRILILEDMLKKCGYGHHNMRIFKLDQVIESKAVL